MSSSSKMENTLENFLIPLEEINSATNNFDKKNLIAESGFCSVYKGKLSERWGNRAAAIRRRDPNSCQGKEEFENELEMVLNIHHPKIITFIGYCVEGKEMITVYEHAINGSLADHLRDINRRSSLTWVQRLRICLAAAQGLNHLHSGLGDYHTVIHRDVKSANILLDDNMEARIYEFGLSRFAPRNQPCIRVHTRVASTQVYTDPLYIESGILTKESDVYSLGVVLFEMLSGMMAYDRRSIGGDRPWTLLNLVRKNWAGGLDKIIDHNISDQINRQSLKTFQRVAYNCISFNLRIRPTMDMIIKEIEKALQFQLLEFVIPLEEINEATNNFHEENFIGEGGFGVVYKGKLSHFWDNLIVAVKCLHPESLQVKDEFKKEHQMVSKFHHPNIIPFIGYCDEGDKKIIVYEYAINGSLDDHLEDRDKRSSLTWVKRLKICLGVARGLGYLHSGLEDHKRVIHRDVKSGNILLDDNLEAKICDFGLSRSAPRNKTITQLHTGVGGTPFYLDPLYQESSILTKESDVYSFGVVLFEVLTGRLAYPQRSFGYDEAQTLIPLVRENWYGGLREIIDPLISEQISTPSLNTFKRIAYKCISLILDERPMMETIIKKIEKSLALQENCYHGDQKIPLEEPKGVFTLSDAIFQVLLMKFPLEKIKLATNNFSKEYLIGGDAHGMVYKGQLYKSVTIAAIKRLPPKLRKMKHKSLNEISIHFTLCHQNIISIIGYCDEGNEMITIYEYAMNGSLDDHLRDPNRRRSLTWAQRLKICIGVAGGLKYLHSGLEDDRVVIHGNVKSSKIFLDENFEAKISDFGLSKSLHRNQPHTQVQTMVGGTPFYLDPVYNESGILTKESDVYSLGVVLFEMLSGMLAYHKRSIGDNEPLHLINLVRENWDGGLDGIVDGDISDQINSRSLETFKRVAYKCISFDLKERPTMDSTMEELQKAQQFQENNDISQQYDTDKDTNP